MTGITMESVLRSRLGECHDTYSGKEISWFLSAMDEYAKQCAAPLEERIKGLEVGLMGADMWVNNNIQGEFEPVGKTGKDVTNYFRDCFTDGHGLHPDVDSLDVFVKVGEVYVEEKDGVAIGIKFKNLLNPTP